MPWHIRPKHHLLQHAAEDQLRSWGSPSSSWCYCDEDFVGGIKKVAGASRHPRTIEARVTEKSMVLAGVDAYLLGHPELAAEMDSFGDGVAGGAEVIDDDEL